MYSVGEQTATIEAQIELGGKTFNLFVTHLGNGGPMVQQEAVLRTGRGQGKRDPDGRFQLSARFGTVSDDDDGCGGCVAAQMAAGHR